MRILADENIPLVDAFFAEHGDIRRMPGRSINRAVLEQAEVLLVRSVTRVDRELLEGSAVRFVGTCTIGTDHLDIDYFDEVGIDWASAPGCNARGVVDYVLGSLLALAEGEGVALHGRRYGVIRMCACITAGSRDCRPGCSIAQWIRGSHLSMSNCWSRSLNSRKSCSN